MEGLHGFLQRRVRIIGVGVIKVNVVGLQFSQTFIDPVFDLFFSQALSTTVTVKSHLGGQYHPVTAFSAGEIRSQQGFAFIAGSLPVGIVVGGVDKVAALAQISIQHRKGLFF
jgi:hypothetical protein